MSGRKEVEADLQNKDSEGGIDNKGLEIIYQRQPRPNKSGHNEVETELADQKMAQNDVEGEMDRARIVEESDNQEELQNEDDKEIEGGAMREAQAPVNNMRQFWRYLMIGGGLLVALSAGREIATNFLASSMIPVSVIHIDNTANMVGRLIPRDMMFATAELAGTAGAGIVNNAISFASKGIITPKLG